MRFSKYHGAGNDFVMVADLDARLGPATSLPADLVLALCDRHKGVGADGVIRVLRSAGGGRYMDYYNADGSVHLKSLRLSGRGQPAWRADTVD